MNIIFSKEFEAKYLKLSKKRPEIRSLFQKAFLKFQKNWRTPSLRVHKLIGQLKDQWAFSIDYSLRVIFEKEKETITFINIGTHDEVYR